MMNEYNFGFIDAATPIMEGIVDLHNTIMFFIWVVVIFVGWMLFNVVWVFLHRTNHPKSATDLADRAVWFQLRNMTHGTTLEIIWTMIPSFILMAIAVPSFGLLYFIDEVVGPAITLKVLGHQWYWSYEYSDYLDFDPETGEVSTINYDSYMIDTAELQPGDHRLLEVDNEVVLPTNVHVRVIVSAVDVLHSWAVPALGVKVDAVPGRLNQTSIYLKREGVYYGQCSEICGVNHGFMPICIKGVSMLDYKLWILE